MIIKAPEERYTTAPEGSFAAVCVDVIDLGLVSNRFDPEAADRAMCRLVWQLDEEDDEGKAYLVRADYTASLHEKAKLRKHLEAWRGRAFSQSELFGFDVDTVIGTGCLISIVHNQGSRGGTFANVGAVMRLPKGMTAPKPAGYIRMKDRRQAVAVEPAKKQQRRVEEEPPQHLGISDDDIPF